MAKMPIRVLTLFILYVILYVLGIIFWHCVFVQKETRSVFCFLPQKSKARIYHMKRIFAAVTVLVLVLTLFSCAEENANVSVPEQSGEQVSQAVSEQVSEEESVNEDSAPDESKPEENVPDVSATEESVPEESKPEESVPEESVPEEKTPEVLFDSSDMQSYASPFLPSYAPFALYDTTAFAGTVITSISFPYYGLADGYTDESEKLYMPVYVVKADFSTKREECTVENGKKILLDFTGKLNGVKSGDWLTVDGLNIPVAADETLAFGDTDMAVLPMFLRNDGTHGFWNKIFDTKGSNNHSLIFKIEGIRGNAGIPSNDDGINAISFLGDSISTYSGWSNNTAHNQSIGGNALWYPNNSYAGADLPVEATWWHRVFTALDYTLCVNNSWSGSKVTDPHTYNVRSKNLHNTSDNISPDIVVILMGINDFGAGIQVGNYDGTTTPPAFPATFSEAYGKLIQTIKDTYEGVEIYCCTVLPDEKRDTVSGGESEYNAVIKLLAENMDVNLIDLYTESGINTQNISSYTVDKLHPNSVGMEKMAEVIINTIKNNID